MTDRPVTPAVLTDELLERVYQEAHNGRTGVYPAMRAVLAPALAPQDDAVEAFYARVNARAETDMLAGKPVTGAHHRALEAEIAAHRSPPAPAEKGPRT